jgi:hypothetical protein
MTDVAPDRPRPPELHGVKSPDRLTRTSGGVVIDEVRPAGEPARSSCSAHRASLSGNLTPHSSGGNRCHPNDASASFEERTDRRSDIQMSRSLNVAIVPVSHLAHPSLLPAYKLHAVVLVTPLTDPPLPAIRLRRPSLPHHTTNLSHTIGTQGVPRADCGRGSVGWVWDDWRPGSGDAPCFQSAG